MKSLQLFPDVVIVIALITAYYRTAICYTEQQDRTAVFRFWHTFDQALIIYLLNLKRLNGQTEDRNFKVVGWEYFC